MGWVRIDGDVAAPPRIREPRSVERRDITALVSDGVLTIAEADLSAMVIQLDEVDELIIESSRLSGVTFEGVAETSVEIFASSLIDCDLSGLRVTSLEASEISGTKLVGTDFSDGRIADTIFRNCILRYTNLRMATIDRVRLEECACNEVDAYDSTLRDLAFPGSTLDEVNIDRASGERVDLREAKTVDLRGIGRLEGFLVREHQLPWLLPALALASGLDIEQPPDD